jgi:hypothetical protein
MAAHEIICAKNTTAINALYRLQVTFSKIKIPF